MKSLSISLGIKQKEKVRLCSSTITAGDNREKE
jgi:hypothetical protein